MTDREISLALGSLLHDIGKVIYRQSGEKKKHSQSGYEFLKDEVGFAADNQEVLDAVRYHHADAIKSAALKKDSLAYIVYMADNIASAADRRKTDSVDAGFEMTMPLQPVFNILNGNKQNFYYEPKTMDEKDGINYPTAEKRPFDQYFYTKVKNNLLNNLKGMKGAECLQEYLNSLLEVMEGNLSYVPSSTAKDELADISLYDHVKLTAAVSACIYAYLQEKGIEDYHKKLFLDGKSFYQENVFVLYTMDISGIQDFIYTIASKNALKTLRARSFYLEIMMEHIIDCFLDELNLFRANLIYSGGGHCYILIPNTKKALTTAEKYMEKLNQWLMEQFHISLYVGSGFAVCSSDSLKNVPQGSYKQIFREISTLISKNKSSRYSAEDIRWLNSMKVKHYTRECKVCKRIEQVDEEGVCSVCRAIEKFSKNILYDKFFTVTLKADEYALPLPGGYYLVSDNEESLKKKMQYDDYFVRTYSKNKMYTGRHIATKLWVGDYTTGKTFEEYAVEAEGIKRIGIIRADVDNLGQAFVAGFESPENHDRYMTLSRTATFSRQLSLFFKFHINQILSEGVYSLGEGKGRARNATIVYSGGDDLFIVGAWDEIIELAVDIRKDFKCYTQGTLTLSAGIGVYSPGYPIRAIAQEVAELEEKSKEYSSKDSSEKNAVTLFPEGQSPMDGTYSWDGFEQQVIGEKYQAIYDFFTVSEDRGMNFLYNLLELIRNKKEKINFARYVYILSRLEPEKTASPEQKEAYQKFSKKMYQWIGNDEDSRQLKTAMNLYVYRRREAEGAEDEIK